MDQYNDNHDDIAHRPAEIKLRLQSIASQFTMRAHKAHYPLCTCALSRPASTQKHGHFFLTPLIARAFVRDCDGHWTRTTSHVPRTVYQFVAMCGLRSCPISLPLNLIIARNRVNNLFFSYSIGQSVEKKRTDFSLSLANKIEWGSNITSHPVRFAAIVKWLWTHSDRIQQKCPICGCDTWTSLHCHGSFSQVYFLSPIANVPYVSILFELFVMCLYAFRLLVADRSPSLLFSVCAGRVRAINDCDQCAIFTLNRA